MSSSRRVGWGLLAVCSVALLVYANALRGEFVFDDIKLIVNNELIKSATHIPDLLFSNLWGALGRASNYYRPLPPLLFMLLHSLFGLRPEPFHVVNIALHSGAAGLVYLLARDLSASTSQGSPRHAHWPALAAGLLFAAHPIHVEAVAWVSGVMDVACTFFSLLALWTYVRSDGGSARPLTYVASLIALFLALLSKEPAAAVPFLVVVYDLLFRRERITTLVDAARRWGPAFGVLGLYLGLRTMALGGVAPFHARAVAGPSVTIANVPVLFVLYIEKLLVPTGLNVVHDIQPVSSLLDIRSLVAVAVIALFVGALVLAAGAREALMAILVFLLPLLPALYVPALSQDLSKAFAERYAYFPSVGVALLVATALTWLEHRRGRWFPAAVATSLAVTVLLSAATLVRNTVWKDSYALWSDSVRKSPNLPLARESLGLALIRRGQPDEGKRELQMALRLDPTLPEQSLAAGILAAGAGQSLQAILAFQTALAYNPELVEAHYNLAVALDAGGWRELAIREYEATLKQRPDHADAHNNLAIVLAQAGRLDDAIPHFEASIRARPDDPELHVNLARAYDLKGLPQLAEEQRRLAGRSKTTPTPSR